MLGPSSLYAGLKKWLGALELTNLSHNLSSIFRTIETPAPEKPSVQFWLPWALACAHTDIQINKKTNKSSTLPVTTMCQKRN